MKRLLLMSTNMALTACDNDPYRNLYDDINSNNDTRRSPAERATAPVPSYDN